MSNLKEFYSNLSVENISTSTPSKEMSKSYQVFDSGKLVDSIISTKDVDGNSLFQVREIKMRKTRKGNAHLTLRGVHMIRLVAIKPMVINGDTVYPEMVIYNSYDGSSALNVHMGVFRSVCSNGLIVAAHDFGTFKIRHIGTEEQQALELVLQFSEKCDEIIKIQSKLHNTILTNEQKIKLAKQAATLRYETPLTDNQAIAFLEPTRTEDVGMDMWSVYNVIQEKVLGGGYKIEGLNKKTTKPIIRAKEDLKLNKKLFEMIWNYTDEVLETVGNSFQDVTTELAQAQLFQEIDEKVDVPIKLRDSKGRFIKQTQAVN